MQWLADDTELAINRQILTALLRSDIEIKGDYNPKIFHQKFILRYYDGSAVPTSALLTGSADSTITDTHRNLNNVVVFRSAHVCRQYLTEVEQLRRESFGRGLHGAAPSTYDLGGVPVRVLFAPDHTPELDKLYVPKKTGAFASLRKLHHKLMVIDELIVVAGYTEPANLYNDEIVFVMESTRDEVSGVEVEVSPTRKLGRFFKAEIERIIGLSEPYDLAA